MPSYGQRPDDVVQDTKGNALQGVTISFYDSESAAEAGGTSLGTATTDNRGRWRFTPATDGELWARLPDATVWQVSPGRVGTKAEIDAEAATRQAADDAEASARRKGATSAWMLVDDNIDTTGVVDCTAALKARFAAGLAAGATRFVGEQGATYKVSIADNTALFTLTGTKGVTVDLSGSTIDNSATSYTSDNFTNVLLIDGAKDTTFLLRDYLGFTLPTPETHLGYRGATLVRAINGADGVKVDARATNLRYGVQTGEYGDPSKGGCKNFDIRFRGTMVGYCFAGYLAEGVRHDIDVNGCHRGVYLGGCIDVKGSLRWRDQYIADTVYLITDALVTGTDAAAQADPVGAATTSRGCQNIDVSSIDKGSTVSAQSSACAGIALSRVDAVTFSDIRIKVFTRSTDTVSRYVGGFKMASSAKSVWSRYAFNWEPTVVIQNVTVTGIVDHSAQTVSGNTAGDFYAVTYDTSGSHAATVQNFKADHLTIHKSSGGTRACYFHAPLLSDQATFSNVTAPIQDWDIFTNGTSTVRFQGSKIGPVSAGSSLVALVDSTSSAIGSSSNIVGSNAVITGAGMTTRQKSTTLTLSGASTSWVAAIPVGALVLAVQGYVTTAITGATGYNLGVSGDVSRYANTNTLTQGSTVGPANQAATEVSPRYYTTATDLVMTAKTSNFTGGQVRLVLTYAQFSAPTS